MVLLLAAKIEWAVAIGSSAGVLVVSGMLALAFWLRRWQRKARAERPPVSQQLLRPRGYGLLQRMDELRDRLNGQLLTVMGLGAVLGIFLIPLAPGLASLLSGLKSGRLTLGQIVAAPGGYWLIFLGTLITGIFLGLLWSVLRADQTAREIQNCRLGLRGEQAVAEMLSRESLGRAGYRAFHDVPGDGAWNIDHVVVGPSGVYVLETKTRSLRRPTRNQPENEVRFDGKTLWFPWCEDHQAARQVKRNARWMEKYLAGIMDSEIPVYPIIVLPGWYVRSQGRGPVKAMRGNYLLKRLLRAEHKFSRQRLRPILSRLEERCRTVEF